MAIAAFAAIDVGSSGLSMKLFELSKQNGIIELTHIRHKMLLGAETFQHGYISYNSTVELCEILKDFTRIMDEYKIINYSAYATSAIREAKNSLLLLDQIKLQTGLKVKIINNSEQRFLRYKAIAMKEAAFNEMIKQGALIVDIGAGSAQFSLFDRGNLYYTGNTQLGFARLHEALRPLEPEVFNYTDLVSEYIDKDLLTFFNINLKSGNIKHIIAVGAGIYEIKQALLNTNHNFLGSLTPKEFKNIELPFNQVHQLLPVTILYNKILNWTKSEDIYFSDIDLCDGIVAEYADKKVKSFTSEKLLFEHDFNKDIINVSKNLAKKYHVSLSHINKVEYFATEIFDRIKKLHGLGKRERLLMQIGAILHSCGAFININETRENSYHIIMSTEIMGLSHNDRVMVANMVRYNSEQFPSYEAFPSELDKDNYITTIKLCAILKIANVLDKSNHQKIDSVRVTLRENELYISANTSEDITLEMGLFQKKATAFESVFGIRPQLKQIRSPYNGKIL